MALLMFAFVCVAALIGANSSRFGSPERPNIFASPNKLAAVANQHRGEYRAKVKPKEIPSYLLMLYYKLAKKARALPFGANFIRTFQYSATKKIDNLHVFNFDVKLSKDEEIVYAMTQLCFAERNKNDKNSSTIQIFDLTTSKWMNIRKSVGGGSGCLEISLTEVAKKAHRKGTPVTLGFRAYELNLATNHQQPTAEVLREPLVIYVFTRWSHYVPDGVMMPSRSVQGKRSFRAKRGCEMRSFYVNFARLGYKNIVVPVEYDAKQCVGACSYPLGKESNPSQHAMIQQLLYSLYGPRVAQPTCCAARKLLPLVVLVNHTQFGGPAIRTFEEMVVDECGCI